jgi:heme O synthase-like polyprenyltransferase
MTSGAPTSSRLLFACFLQDPSSLATPRFDDDAQNQIHTHRCRTLGIDLPSSCSQTINDWYDRDIDAINEPNRPIPSGAISEGEVIAQIWTLLLGKHRTAFILQSEHASSLHVNVLLQSGISHFGSNVCDPCQRFPLTCAH